MTTLRFAALALFIGLCSACNSRTEQASSPTSPEDQLVPSGAADSLGMADTVQQQMDTAVQQ